MTYNAPVARVEGLPERIDPVRLAERGGRLCGSLPVARLGRLAESLCDPAGAVRVDVGFETDREGRHLARGPIKARLSVRCQRCLEPMDIVIDTELGLAFVEEGGEAHPPEGYEPVPVGGGTISPAELIEDEIILALPMAPMHEGCSAGAWCGGEPGHESREPPMSKPGWVETGCAETVRKLIELPARFRLIVPGAAFRLAISGEFLGNRQWLYSRTESRLHGGTCADPTTGSMLPRFR